MLYFAGQVKVHRIHIGTTHFVNAVVQRRNLAKVAIIRLCGQATSALPPFSDFPPDLKKVQLTTFPLNICASNRIITNFSTHFSIKIPQKRKNCPFTGNIQFVRFSEGWI